MDQQKKTIMITWDFTEKSLFALEHAIRLARIMKNNMLLFHIVPEQSDVEKAKENIQKTVLEVREKYGVDVDYFVNHGSIFNEIAKYASEEKNNVTFVIMGTHGMKGKQKFFGSWALRVITGSKVPFIVVQDAPPNKDRFTDIVFPIDFKSENKEKLQWAIFLGKYLNSKIHLYKAPITDKDLQKKVNVNLNFAIRFLIQNNIDYEIHTARKTANFTREILAFTKSINADLILITTTKHITFLDYVFGAKEQYLLSNSEKIPVMCVNPKSQFAKVGQFMYG
ncbi:MAG: universal stress protein [Bacteroidales bacterium]|nr:universal stress protein [Bacteroidales bacterium]MBN2698567.1 universal stress protein [Bacteroidales bacterium]